MLSYFTCVHLFATLLTVSCQVPQSMGFSRQEYWNGLSCSLPGDRPDPGIKPMSPALQVDSLPLSHQGRPYANAAAAAAAKLLQPCPTLCDPIDGSPPGSPVPGILQARTLEWVAISFSNAWKRKVKGKSLSRSDSSQPHGLQPTRLLRPWDFPGKSTGVGCHRLLRMSCYLCWNI